MTAEDASELRRPAGSELLAPLLSLLLGILSVAVLLRLATGIPAIAFGLFGLRRLNAFVVEANLVVHWGRQLAIGGMALGATGCVLGVVGLISLALLRVGETARRTTCANNLRQIGKAVNLYHDLHKEYPRPVVARDLLPAVLVAPWLGEPYSARLSWLVEVLPFLERPDRPGQARIAAPFEELAAKFDRDRNWDDPVNRTAIDSLMKLYLCPSHPDHDPSHRPALTHYAGLAGVGAKAVELSRGSPLVGFFGYERRLTRDLIPAGQSQTLVATETTIANGPWAAGGFPTVRGIDPAERQYIGWERPFGGLHPVGANLLMADGSVRVFTASGSPDVLEALGSLAGTALPDE